MVRRSSTVSVDLEKVYDGAENGAVAQTHSDCSDRCYTRRL